MKRGIYFLSMGMTAGLFTQAADTALTDILLGRPTDHSITISVMASSNLQAYCEYGTTIGVYTAQTSMTNIDSGIPCEINLTGLQANTRYAYRLRTCPLGETNTTATTGYSFQTQRSTNSSYTFVIEADPHYMDPNSSIDPALWQLALTNMLADSPDFLIDLGDTFMGEKYYSVTNTYPLSRTGIDDACKNVRNQFFGLVGHSLPLFLVNGNHDPELGWLLNQSAAQSNSAVWATQSRERYYPCPVTDAFYSGATNTDPYMLKPRDSYYSFKWGNSLFVMLDPYWETCQGISKSKDPWAWTLGTNQYTWLQQTLSNSTAKFKFVFIHHLVGGSFDMAARGGLEYASYFEWGGYNTNGTWGFTSNRPGWPMPIQSILLSNGVNAVFHGHDHLFVKQDLDTDGDGTPNLIYMECPQPCATNYNSTGTAAGYGYTNGIILGSSGHIKINVTPSNALLSYVRAYMPAAETGSRSNRMISCSYTIAGTMSTNTPFPGSLIPGRPTDNSVTLNILANTNLLAYIEYGTQPGAYSNQTSTTSFTAGQPTLIQLTNLSVNTRHYYRLRFKYGNEPRFRTDEERSLQTQRQPGCAFSFDIQTDEHLYDKKGSTNLYWIAVSNMLADQPDFLIDLGDIFGDDHNPDTITAAEMDQLHLNYLPFLDIPGRAAPLFLCIGNHEAETIGYETPATNANPICSYATQARLRYYPNPVPNTFYSGNTNTDIYVNTNRVAGLPANYFSWEWGDALFVVLDAYRYLDSAKPSNLWNWTLGKPQYDWFKTTLETSRKPYKFVFAHHILGQTRGGVIWAGLYEWGGTNNNGNWGFTANRPGWPMPIHQLMASNNVTVFFHGHDHLYAHEQLDGIVYQEVPTPSDATYHVGDTNATAYTGIVTNNSGHLRITVTPASARVDYVSALLPADETATLTNRAIVASYTATSSAPFSASFACTTSTGPASLTVQLSDTSTGTITNRLWDFGDGTSSQTNLTTLTHTYQAAGTYTVRLTVTSTSGISTSFQTAIHVSAPTSIPTLHDQGLRIMFSLNQWHTAISLSDVANLIWIDQELARKNLSPKKKATLSSLCELSLANPHSTSLKIPVSIFRLALYSPPYAIRFQTWIGVRV